MDKNKKQNGQTGTPLVSKVPHVAVISAEEMAATQLIYEARAEASNRKLERIATEVRRFMERVKTHWPDPADRKCFARHLETCANWLRDEAETELLKAKIGRAGAMYLSHDKGTTKETKGK
jgi:hypothetical protein